MFTKEKAKFCHLVSKSRDRCHIVQHKQWPNRESSSILVYLEEAHVSWTDQNFGNLASRSTLSLFDANTTWHNDKARGEPKRSA